MGNRFFELFQYGTEAASAHGTPVDATAIWPGQTPRVTSDTQPSYPVEQFNVRMESRRGLAYQRLYSNTLMASHAGFQQLLLPFGCGLKGAVSPAIQNTGEGDYLWTFTPSLTAANNPDSFTAQFGDDAKRYRVPYCMFNRINISGDIAQDGGEAPVSIEAEFFGRYIEENAITAGQSLKDSTPINAKYARLYVDTSWAGVGGTEFSDLLRGFQIEILTGVHPASSGAAYGANYFSAHKEGIIGYTATFNIEGGEDAADALLAQQAQSLVVCRLEITGPQIGAGDSHRLTIDMGGTWETVGPIDNEDRGDNLGALALHATYDDTGAKGLQVEVLTDASAY